MTPPNSITATVEYYGPMGRWCKCDFLLDTGYRVHLQAESGHTRQENFDKLSTMLDAVLETNSL